MSVIEALANRRSYYAINKDLPVPVEKVEEVLKKVTELVPDAFNMKSQRIVLVKDSAQDKLWDTIYESFKGKVSREKIDGFKAGAGTILYFCDSAVVQDMQKQFPSYAENFPVWANQANGMLQINMWSALRELGIGANIQHYNPVIDARVKELFSIPASFVLLAEMPFGGIAGQPQPKETEDISQRFFVQS